VYEDWLKDLVVESVLKEQCEKDIFPWFLLMLFLLILLLFMILIYNLDAGFSSRRHRVHRTHFFACIAFIAFHGGEFASLENIHASVCGKTPVSQQEWLWGWVETLVQLEWLNFNLGWSMLAALLAGFTFEKLRMGTLKSWLSEGDDDGIDLYRTMVKILRARATLLSGRRHGH
jgi:hypothetical protein